MKITTNYNNAEGRSIRAVPVVEYVQRGAVDSWSDDDNRRGELESIQNDLYRVFQMHARLINVLADKGVFSAADVVKVVEGREYAVMELLPDSTETDEYGWIHPTDHASCR